MSFSPPEPLPTMGPRVVLRRLRETDLSAFQQYRRDEKVGRYQGWTPQSDAEALAFLQEMGSVRLFSRGAWIQIAIADRVHDVLIGDIGICIATSGETAEIGFTMSPRAQGMGRATEAVLQAIQLLFQHTPILQVVGITDARNTSSMRLLERVGMQRIATQNAIYRGEPCVEHVYAIFRSLDPGYHRGSC